MGTVATVTPTQELTQRLRDCLAANVVVTRETIDLVLVCLLARGHLLIEDVPGVGKTLLARRVAGAIGGVFHRIQFTPDLLPADITGGSVYNQHSGEFSFRPGPVFANCVLADEINRGTPRAQSALLEAMGEGFVSVDGASHALADPFLVIATQNPIEQHGTFPLPEAEVDRFMMQIGLGRPDAGAMAEILARHEHAEPERTIVPVCSVMDVLRAQASVREVYVAPPARQYITAVVMATGEHPAVTLAASPRAAVALMRAAQAAAAVAGRPHLLPDDVKRVAAAVLGHRLGLVGEDAATVVAEIVSSVPVHRALGG